MLRCRSFQKERLTARRRNGTRSQHASVETEEERGDATTHSSDRTSDSATLVTSRGVAFSVGNELIGSTLEGLTGELVAHQGLERVVDGIEPTKPAEPRLHLSRRNNVTRIGHEHGKGESRDCCDVKEGSA